MAKKGWVGLGLGAVIVVIAVVLYSFFLGGAPQVGPGKPEKPEATSQPPAPTQKPTPAGATVPAPAEQPEPPLPERITPPETTFAKPDLGPAAPPKTVLPPLEPEHKYGLVAGSYRKYRDAAKRMEKLKRLGQPAFIDKYRGKYRVWVGPFATSQEARAAAKLLQKSRISARLHKLIMPVPK